MHILREPEPEAALAFLQSALAGLKEHRGRLVQVFANCTVDYQGRAASTLDQGERLIMLKPDGTLLVHTGEKSKPVNWMPPGENRFSVAEKDGRIELTALRRKPHEEVVRIFLHDVRLLLSVPMRDAQELVLRRTEGDLHALFYAHPELIEPGLVFHRGEKDTRRGPVDLWGTDKEGHRVLVEVKRSKGGISEATQLWRYVEMERNGRYAVEGDVMEGTANVAVATRSGKNGSGKTGANGQNGKTSPKVRGILACPGISDKAQKMLSDHGLEHVAIDWDDLLQHLDAPRAAGQATLGRFGGDGLKDGDKERTVRTGRRRKG
ncbi:MAG: DUF91 domain-containing protein [Euryarchaeota archaeon]|nr:DUF91 domain-containing protein [Euryarchaeota archaeon]